MGWGFITQNYDKCSVSSIFSLLNVLNLAFSPLLNSIIPDIFIPRLK